MNKNYKFKRLPGFGEFLLTPLNTKAACKLVRYAARCRVWVNKWDAILPVTKKAVLLELDYELSISLYINGRDKPTLFITHL